MYITIYIYILSINIIKYYIFLCFILYVVLHISIFKKYKILAYIFNTYKITNIKCSNNTYILECANMSYINSVYKLSNVYTNIYQNKYTIYNSIIISNISIINQNKNKSKIKRHSISFKYKYSLYHFCDAYISQIGVLYFKCIDVDVKLIIKI